MPQMESHMYHFNLLQECEIFLKNVRIACRIQLPEILSFLFPVLTVTKICLEGCWPSWRNLSHLDQMGHLHPQGKTFLPPILTEVQNASPLQFLETADLPKQHYGSIWGRQWWESYAPWVEILLSIETLQWIQVNRHEWWWLNKIYNPLTMIVAMACKASS